MTHYLPAFTTVHLRDDGAVWQRAVCGAVIPPGLHAAEPTCLACQCWLESGPSPTTEATL